MLYFAAMELEGNIREPVLRELVLASSVLKATITGQENGFSIVFRLGDAERVLATTRGTLRLFATLDTAAAFIRHIGIDRFEVDMTRHRPGRLRKPRPDRAEALRQTRTRMQQQPLGFQP